MFLLLALPSDQSYVATIQLSTYAVLIIRYNYTRGKRLLWGGGGGEGKAGREQKVWGNYIYVDLCP